MSTVLLYLDTVGPAGITASINAGASTTVSRDVTLGITTSDPDPAGYTIKVWGNVDPAANANIQATEGASSWISWTTAQAVRLSTGEGTKTLNVKVRDTVNNESSSASDTIVLDTTTPVVTTGTPDASRISEQPTKDTAAFTFQSTEAYEEFKVKVVPATNSPESAGTQIPTAAGSTGVSGSAGGYAANTNRTVTIKATDLKTASAGDGQKIVKVFVREASGTWSV
jgi:hypothetical protein